MGSRLKDRPSVAKNRQKPPKIHFMTALSRFINIAEDPSEIITVERGKPDFDGQVVNRPKVRTNQPQ